MAKISPSRRKKNCSARTAIEFFRAEKSAAAQRSQDRRATVGKTATPKQPTHKERNNETENLFFVFLFTAVVFFSGASLHGAESPYKISIGFPSLAFSYMPFYVAQEKGIYKKYGIESEYIQMGTTIQPQAVVAGNINYFTSVSTGISAAVAGLPLVIVISFCDSSPWVLVTQKDINKPQDLIGKTVALSGIRTSPYYFFQAFLKKSEINEKDVSTINTGGTADSFRALTTNRVVATVLTPPFDDKAVSLGYKKFMQFGDLADIPYVGLVTSQNEIKTNRESVRRTVAAVMESLAWLRANRAESTKMIVDKFKVNQQEAENTYATLIQALEQRRQTQSQSRARLPRHPAPRASDPGGLRPEEGRRLLFAAGESIAE